MTTKRFTKSFLAEFTKDAAEPGTFTGVFNTDAVDRDGEVLIPQGCNTKEYEENPVLTCAHLTSSDVKGKLPVGQCVSIRRTDDALIGKFAFAPRPSYHVGEWLPDYVRGLVECKALRALSVDGMSMPRGYRGATQSDREKYGPECIGVMNMWKLVGITLTSIPSNQEALVMAVSKGFVTADAVKRWSGVTVQPRRAMPAIIRVRVPELGEDDVAKSVGEAIAKARGRIYA